MVIVTIKHLYRFINLLCITCMYNMQNLTLFLEFTISLYRLSKIWTGDTTCLLNNLYIYMTTLIYKTKMHIRIQCPNEETNASK